jgi:CBS domain containing-hemolysin-like protein
MFWLLLILYCFVLLSERAIVAIGLHDLELLRNDESGPAKRVIKVTDDLKGSMEALLLTRLLLKICMVITLSTWLKYI